MNFECARIHYEGRLLNKGLSALTLPLRKVAFMNQKRNFYRAKAVVRLWREHIQLGVKANQFAYCLLATRAYQAFQALK